MIDLDDLIIPSEIADLLGVTRGCVSNWRKRNVDFPLPVFSRGVGKHNVSLFSRKQVLAWDGMRTAREELDKREKLERLEAEVARIKSELRDD